MKKSSLLKKRDFQHLIFNVFIYKIKAWEIDLITLLLIQTLGFSGSGGFSFLNWFCLMLILFASRKSKTGELLQSFGVLAMRFSSLSRNFLRSFRTFSVIMSDIFGRGSKLTLGNLATSLVCRSSTSSYFLATWILHKHVHKR